MADEEHEHDWRIGPVVADRFLDHCHAVCLGCWTFTVMSAFESRQWPHWEEQDYWDNLDVIEGDRAPEIRRMAGRL
jgi:hypothetical protein